MSYGVHVFSICPLSLLVISFRKQNWRRGWDPKSRPRVKWRHSMAISVLSTKSQRNIVIMPIANDIDNERKVNVFVAVIRC